jgi:hypothetical protein
MATERVPPPRGDSERDILAECARSDASLAGCDLDETARAEGMDFQLRYAYAHMIQETARHAGHLDLLREVIDGSRGQ